MNSRGGILFVSFYAVQFKALGKRLICGQRVSKPTLCARAAKGHLETFPALPRMSATGGEPDEIRAKADIAFGGRPGGKVARWQEAAHATLPAR